MFQLGSFLQPDPEQSNYSVPDSLNPQVPSANQDGWF